MNTIQLKSLRNTLPILAAFGISMLLIVFAVFFAASPNMTADACGGCGLGGDSGTGDSGDGLGGECGNSGGGDDPWPLPGTRDGGPSTNCTEVIHSPGTRDEFTTIVCGGEGGGGNTPSPPPIICTSDPNACGDTLSQSITTYTLATETTTGMTCSDGSNPFFGMCSVLICDTSTKTPPPNPAGYGDTCTSAANSCGKTSTGTVQCDGNCSAITPSDSLCDASCVDTAGDACQSAANSCGNRNNGTQLCDGSCSVSVPSKYTSCTLTNSCGIFNGVSECGGACSVAGDPNYCPSGGGDGTPITIDITATPALLRSGGSTTILWNEGIDLSKLDSCKVSYDDGDSWIGIQDSQDITLLRETTFKLECKSVNGGTITDDVTVRVVREWQEI